MKVLGHKHNLYMKAMAILWRTWFDKNKITFIVITKHPTISVLTEQFTEFGCISTYVIITVVLERNEKMRSYLESISSLNQIYWYCVFVHQREREKLSLIKSWFSFLLLFIYSRSKSCLSCLKLQFSPLSFFVWTS